MVYSECNVPLVMGEAETLVLSDGRRLMWRMGEETLLVYLLGGPEPRCVALGAGEDWTIRTWRSEYTVLAGENVLFVDRSTPTRRPWCPAQGGSRGHSAPFSPEEF